MRDQRYQLISAPLLMSYEFTSEGPKGNIQKIIKYTETGNPAVYNLGFGDKLGDTDDYNDLSISDNKDSVRVLATVASSAFTFTDAYPNLSIFASGSTPSRTRLYRMGISNNLEEIEKDFVVLGYINDNWEFFERNRDYLAFLIKRKK